MELPYFFHSPLSLLVHRDVQYKCALCCLRHLLFPRRMHLYTLEPPSPPSSLHYLSSCILQHVLLSWTPLLENDHTMETNRTQRYEKFTAACWVTGQRAYEPNATTWWLNNQAVHRGKCIFSNTDSVFERNLALNTEATKCFEQITMHALTWQALNAARQTPFCCCKKVDEKMDDLFTS